MFMATVRLVDSDRPRHEEFVEHYDTLEEALQDMRALWNEDDQNFHVLIRDFSQGLECVAMMFKDMRNPGLCETRYADGRIERHYCEYVDADDRVLCEITPLALVPTA